MGEVIFSVLIVSVFAALMVLLMKGISSFFRTRYGVGIQYVIWIVLAIRIIMPVFPIPFHSAAILLQKNPVDSTSAGMEGVMKIQLQRGFPTDQENAVLSSAYVAQVGLVETGRTEPDYESAGNLTVLDNADKTYLYQNSKRMIWQEHGKVKEADSGNAIGGMVAVAMGWWLFAEKLLFMIWAGGMVLFAMWNIGCIVLYRRKLKKSSQKMDNYEYTILLKECALAVGIKKIPRIMRSQEINAPMVTGFGRQILYMPYEEYTLEEAEILFYHELVHIKHKDLWWKMLLLIANMIHWFNPFVYMMVKESHKTMEFVCDSTVVKNMGKEKRHAYNELLLTVIEKRQRGYHDLSTGFSCGLKTMKERFGNILDMSRKKKAVTPLLIVMVMIVLSGVGIAYIEADTTHEGDRVVKSEMNVSLAASSVAIPVRTKLVKSRMDSKLKIQKLLRGFQTEDTWEEWPGSSSYYEPVAEEQVMVETTVENYDGTKDPYTWYVTPNESTIQKPPEIKVNIYGKNIEYGLILEDWLEDDSEIQQTPDFFAAQAAKGEEIPVFYTNQVSDALINIYFMDNPPQAAEIEEFVMDEKGGHKYPGYSYEVIHRQPSLYGDLMSFNLGEHATIRMYEDWVTMEQLRRPFFRGYKIHCIWVSEEYTQVCTYLLVIRTIPTAFGKVNWDVEKLNEFEVPLQDLDSQEIVEKFSYAQ